MANYFCYIIINNNNRLYTGITNNLDRRINQHNGLLAGGAKSTRISNTWKYKYIIGIFDKKSALKFEYELKYNNNSRITGIINKYNRLNFLLLDPRWKNIQILNNLENYRKYF